MQFARKRGFTFVEIIIVIFVLTVTVTGIVFALNKGVSFVGATKQRVIAVNLAREGMEGVYNMRDTNRQRWAGKRDECWLKIDPLDDGGDGICSDDSWMQSGFYSLLQKELHGQKYFVLSGNFVDKLDLSDGINTGELAYSLCQSGAVWSACPGGWPDSSEGNYWRQIHIKGLFLKDEAVVGGEAINCSNGEAIDPKCAESRAKELRFCSRVGFQGEGYGIIELCGVMTNFLE